MNIYDNRYREGQFTKINYLIQNLSSQHGLILDFGCGTGLLFEYFIQSGGGKKKPFKMIGIDLSVAMISEFQTKAETTGHKRSDVHLVVCDGENLPFRGESFDDIYALTSLQNLPNLKEGLNQIQRVGFSGCRYGLTFLKKSLELTKLAELMQTHFPGIMQILPDTQNNLRYDRQYQALEDWLFVRP